ncbi:MAG: hypothetical protein AAFN79_10275 [Pseudomonadota bacterium]
MSVETVLDKLREHNVGVIGCLATHGGASYSNLKEPYELIDGQSVGEEARQIFELFDGLEAPEAGIDEVFLEMRHHSIYAHRLDDGVLVVLNKPMDRSVFRRLKVGVNLFVKPLKRELANGEAPAPAPAAKVAAPVSAEPDQVETAPSGAKKKKRFYRGVEY